MSAAKLAVTVAVVLATAFGAGSQAASAATADTVAAALGRLDSQLNGKGSLRGADRTAVHAAKADLIATAYKGAVSGVTYADVLTGLDCVDTDLQRARNVKSSRSRSSGWAKKALACADKLTAALRAGGKASEGLLGDMATLRSRIVSVRSAARRGKSFGTKSKEIRSLAAAIASRRIDGSPFGVSFAETFTELECIDVKVESGRTSGASFCARRLQRLVKAAAPPKPVVVWGSDLTGDPVSIDGTWREDSEFWGKDVSAPVAGRVTELRLKVGSNPTTLPIRFSVVRPRSDGSVTVITTTDPPFMLPARSPRTYTFKTSDVNFSCCKVAKGDIVSVDNSGANTVSDPFHWFAQKPGFTTFSHMVRGVSQGAGQVWTPTAHPGYELLLQITEQPD